MHAWDSNPALQNGRRKRIHWAIATHPPLFFHLLCHSDTKKVASPFFLFFAIKLFWHFPQIFVSIQIRAEKLVSLILPPASRGKSFRDFTRSSLHCKRIDYLKIPSQGQYYKTYYASCNPEINLLDEDIDR